MAGRIKGIQIEIGGNTTGLEKALQNVNKKSRSLQSELKEVDRHLKFNPKSVELMAQKQQLLTEQVGNTSEKLKQLQKAQSQVEAQFKSGKIGEEQYRAFKREVEKTESQLGHYKTELQKVESAQRGAGQSVNKLGDSFKKAGKEVKGFANDVGKGLAGAAAVGATAITGLVTGMQEYNQDLARLRTNASMAGRDLELVENAFMRITEVTGEADSAVETVSNLLASGFQDNQLAQAIDLINGAAIRFSDTLKTEGIADGLQETFATGEAIGPFAELLERSGVDLEKFNQGLQMAQIVGNETNYVMRILSEQGFAEVYDKYKQLNPEVQANAEANAKFQKSLADLAVVLTPLITQVTEMITGIVGWAEKNPALAKTIAVITGAVVALTVAVGALSLVLTPIGGIVIGVGAAITGLILIFKNWGAIQDWLGKKVANFIGNALTKFYDLRDKIKGVVSAIVGAFANMVLKIPKPKLPKFSISGKFDLIPPDISVPKINVSWFKDGGLMTNPTVFGRNGNTLMAGGEAGPEAILPLNDSVLGKIAGMIAQHMPQSNQKIEIPLYLNGYEIARASFDELNRMFADDVKRKSYSNGLRF